MSKTLTAAILMLALTPTLAFAETERASCTDAPKAQWLSQDQLKSKIHAAGYTDIRSMTLRGTCYEVYAITKSGQRAEINVDPATAAIYNAEDGD